jgi:general secretion pathway protein J
MSQRAAPHRRNRRGSAGFTLIELLVGLALFALLTSALFGGVRYGIESWRRTTSRIDAADNELHVQNFLRRSIEDAYPLFISDGPTRKYVDFAGDVTSVELLTTAPVSLATAGRSRLKVSVADSEGHLDLVATSSMELASRDDQTLTAKTLLNGLQSVSFAYFGRLDRDKAPTWHDRWVQQPAFPLLVRVEVHYPTGDGRRWPELLVAPRITADVGCVYDPLTNGCRGR